MIFREYEESSDGDQVQELERLAFEIETIPWIIPWLEQNPYGKSVMVVAADNQKITGFLVILPEPVCGFGKRFTCGYAMRAMAHPEYRRRGIYTQMSAFAFELSRQRGIDFCLGYTLRENVLWAELKMGWHLADRVPILAIPVSLERGLKNPFIQNHLVSRALSLGERCYLYTIVRRCTQILKHGTYNIKTVEHFSDEYDQLAEAAVAERQFALYRSADLLNWRYSNNQNGNGKYVIIEARQGTILKGALVFRRKKLLEFDGVALLDIVTGTHTPTVLRELCAWALLNFVLPLKPDVGGCMISRYRWEYRVLRGLGFLPTFKDFKMIIHPLRDGIEPEIQNGTKWLNLWGNSDLI